MTRRSTGRYQRGQGHAVSRLPSIALLVGTAVLFSGLTAAAMTIATHHDNTPPPATRAPVTTTHPTTPMPAPATIATTAPTPNTSPPPTQPPVAVAIPAINVMAEVDPMGLTPAGQLQVPTNFQRVGWWSGGHKPGEPGPAILEGHVDSTKGPAIFYALRRLQPGDQIRVARSDRSTAVFVVDRLESYPKDSFPSLEVYGPTDTPTLRLITCTGSFNTTRHSYRDNLVVYANLKTDPQPSPTRGP